MKDIETTQGKEMSNNEISLKKIQCHVILCMHNKNGKCNANHIIINANKECHNYLRLIGG